MYAVDHHAGAQDEREDIRIKKLRRVRLGATGLEDAGDLRVQVRERCRHSVASAHGRRVGSAQSEDQLGQAEEGDSGEGDQEGHSR